MKVWSSFLLFGIFAYTNSTSRIKPKEDHRVVNLPQGSVSEYSNEEYSGDINDLDNVHTFINKGTAIQGRNKNNKLVFRAPRVETLTDFIQKAVHILNTYEDTAFEDFFHVLDSEIRKYHYRGCKFSELTQNSDTRSLLARSLKLIRGKSVSFTKANINEVADRLRDETYDQNVQELLDYINSLYTNTEQNFDSVLNDLKYFRNTKSVRTHNNLVRVIRGGLRAVLFDPYTELNSHTRRAMKEKIEIFWKRFKNNYTPSVEVNDIPYTDPVINSFKASENLMNEVKNPENYSTNDSPAKLKNKRERIVSIETFGEQSQHDGIGQDESSNESGKKITFYNTDEISSGQSFDSSSNSIKNSQERHEEYNTQRYMTLFTEEISYKAKNTKETEIIPMSANMMTGRPKVKKRSKTTYTPRDIDVSRNRADKIKMLRANHDTDDTKLDVSNSNQDAESGLTLESKHDPRARENYNEQQKQGEEDESRSRSKQKNVKIISQYDAVIDVQLANTELLKSLRMFEPLGVDRKYDTTLNPKSAKQTKPYETYDSGSTYIPTKSKKRLPSMRGLAEIKPQKPSIPTKTPPRYSKTNKPLQRKQLRNFRKNIAPLLLNEGRLTNQLIKNKNQNQKYLRRSDNDINGTEKFHTYVIERINAMQNELNELKQMSNFSSKSKKNDNNTRGVEARNITDKFEEKHKLDSKRKDMKGNVIERLLNEDHDLNNEEANDGNEFITRNNTKMNIESSTNNTKPRKLNVIKKDAVNKTIIDTKNTTQVTNNVTKLNVNGTNKLSEEVIINNVTTSTITLVKVTNTTKVKSVVTTPRVGITRRTMAYSEPSYYDSQQENRPTAHNSQFDPFFDHINDGIDLRM